jgi:hypothetical protein
VASWDCWSSRDAGASPLFPPQHRTADAARTALAEVLHRAPRLFGLVRSRWWLDGLRQVVAWLRPLSLAGVWRLLRRLGLRYKRGRQYLHSPDPAYRAKLAQLRCTLGLARWRPARYVVLFSDEFTYYRRASVAQGYAGGGEDAPRADQGWRTNFARRIVGSLNALTGAHLADQQAHFPQEALLAHYRQIAAHYPQARRIFVWLDNWPTHQAEALVAALHDTPIRLCSLPTYAPWTNPEEKVWRKLYQEVLHRHAFRDDWAGEQAAVTAWLTHLADDPASLLHYVGLSPV